MDGSHEMRLSAQQEPYLLYLTNEHTTFYHDYFAAAVEFSSIDVVFHLIEIKLPSEYPQLIAQRYRASEFGKILRRVQLKCMQCGAQTTIYTIQ